MKSQKIRYGVQIIFLILILIVSINHLAEEQGWTFLPTSPNLHAVCPFGGVATIYTSITQDTLVKKLHPSSIVLMWGVLFSALLLGAIFCGWICPFGTIQEFLGKVGRKLFKRRYNNLLPRKIKPYLSYFRYIFLAIIIYKTAETGKLFFEPYDPYSTLFNIWSDELSVLAYVILGITLVAALIEERAWCKFACPFGAILGLFNKFSLYKIHLNSSQCISCGACNRHCPLEIDVQNGATVNSSICTRCGKCLTVCPAKSDTIEYQIGKFREVNQK